MVGQLSLGMYVAELDRPWLETPFKLQGFMLKNQEQLIELSSLCSFVYIDIEKGIESSSLKPIALRSGMKVRPSQSAHVIPPAIYSFTRYNKSVESYKKDSNFYKVAAKVAQVQLGAQEALKGVADSLSRGEVFDQLPIKKVASDIVVCVIENPDVMSWLGRIHESDHYTHDHCVRSATWASVTARYLGVSRQEMTILVQAVLLKDVGTMRLPQHLLLKNESDLSIEESRLYQKYVSLSVALLQQVKGLDEQVLQVIQAHRECYDGSGFPRGLTGDNIPLLSIIAHVSSLYDSLVNPRNESKQCSPSDAMRQLHLLKNTLFQEDLVVDFNQALGLFPAGSVVELNTGELAVVIEQNDERKLRPVIFIMTDAQLMPLRKRIKIDLLTQARAPQHEESGRIDQSLPELYIIRDLATNQCSADLLKLKNELFTGKRSVFSLLKRS